jgi:aminoglycoside phosphotransferase family enzyme
MDTYNTHFYALRTPEENLLFIYFKSYRANVRAKVNALRAMTASSDSQQAQSLMECERYLRLMQSYID